MKIALLIEGDTEQAFLRHLRRLLELRASGNMPRIDPVPYDGRIPKGEKLKREVERLLSTGRQPADAVIASKHVSTGSNHFKNAADSKQKMWQDFILASSQIHGIEKQLRYLRQPSQREPDFGAESVNYSLSDLLRHAEVPA